jgi:hypothetical protein
MQSLSSTVQKPLTFMAPFVAIALRDRDVMKVQRQHMAVRRRVSPIPAMPTILGTKNQEQRISRAQI